MRVVTTEEAHRTWIVAERIKRVSDRLVGLGSFSIGLDGLLAPVPVLGTAYSLIAGLWLLSLGVRTGATPWTLARMTFYVGFRTLSSLVPMEGWLVDVLFRGHMLAANALQTDIERRFGAPPNWTARHFAAHPVNAGAAPAY